MRASVKILIGLLAGNLVMVAGPLTAAPHWKFSLIAQSGGDFAAPARNAARASANNTEQSSPVGHNTDGTANQKTALGLTANADQSTAKQQNSLLLRNARRAMARGDLDTASRLSKQAADLKIAATPGEDSAAIVNVLIADHRNASELMKNRDKLAPKTVAAHLLRQAEGMIAYKDYEVARHLASQAEQFTVEYSDGETTPQDMLKRLESLRAVARIRTGNDSSVAATQQQSQMSAKEQALRLMAEARLSMKKGNYQAAAVLSQRATALNVPDSEFAEGEPRPWALALDIQSELGKRGGAVQQATYTEDSSTEESSRVVQSAYNPSGDNTRTMPASATEPTKTGPSNRRLDPRASTVETTTESSLSAREHYGKGLAAMARKDVDSATESFRQAWIQRTELTDDERQKLKISLATLQTLAHEPVQPASANQDAADLQRLDQVKEEQAQLFSALRSEVYRVAGTAQDMVERKDPRGGLNQLFELRDRIANAQLNPAKKKPLLTTVDRHINDMQKYIEVNISQIQVDEQNAMRKESVDKARERKTDVELQVQALVEDFNRLVDEGRYPEAEVVARQAKELAPDLDVVVALEWKAKFMSRWNNQMSIRDRKEQGFHDAMTDVDEAGIVNVSDRFPMRYSDNWAELSARRLQTMQGALGESVEDIRIRNLIRNTKVDVRFDNNPLQEVAQLLSQQTGVNIALDLRALQEQGVTQDSPVSLNLTNAVSLESALNMLLESQNLTYMVKDETVQITSKERRDRNHEKRTYYVADLVIPIPNFSPPNNMGLSAAVGHSLNQAAYAANGVNSAGKQVSYQQPMMAAGGGPENNAVLGQVGMPGSGGGAGAGGMGGMMGAGPGFGAGGGGLGGGIVADFDPLMELIQTTIETGSWEENGGTGTMSEFASNLSLVISNTQEVHEQIQSLLDQLRRLQDLQITIEVRFITLQDDFFERIGIDFDFNLEDSSGLTNGVTFPDRTRGTVVSGLQDGGIPTPNNDLQFSQDSFSLSRAIPSLSGFDPAGAANFGFAILSDIEVFFLIEASKGDNRSNILQAPKVTLFNGQTATVADQTQRPFVTSVIPVVGDFAAAHQPVITVLSEGTSLTVNAVATSDRRFVRLTLIPFFSQITDVDEFTFTGSQTTSSGTNVFDPTDPANILQDDESTTTAGTTVQLPVFAITTVQTTVNVPDGGTVLLGGIKRLSERRDERGVPFLSNIPYVSRLFKNVGIGRTSNSLMMMVTPRIIIQEEEEQRQVPGIGN